MPLSKDASGGRIVAALGLAASVIGILAFFGISNFHQLTEDLSPASGRSVPGSPPAMPTSSPTYGPLPSTFSPAPTPASSPAAYTPAPSAPTFDPGSLDQASTDQTPFTEAALLAPNFTDSEGVYYSLVASGGQACTNPNMTSNIRFLLSSSGCQTVMTGDYLEDGGNIADSKDVLVSVQVFPFDNASTAQQISNDLTTTNSGSFGIFCPINGPGSNDCGAGYQSARIAQFWLIYHRYLVEATALYTNLTPNSEIQPWLDAAARRATNVCGPGNYVNNH